MLNLCTKFIIFTILYPVSILVGAIFGGLCLLDFLNLQLYAPTAKGSFANNDTGYSNHYSIWTYFFTNFKICCNIMNAISSSFPFVNILDPIEKLPLLALNLRSQSFPVWFFFFKLILKYNLFKQTLLRLLTFAKFAKKETQSCQHNWELSFLANS